MKTFFLVFSLVISTISYGQKHDARLAAAYKVFEADARFKHALISLYVVDSKTGKVVFDKKISAPEVFKLVFDSNDKVMSIENLEFDDLK